MLAGLVVGLAIAFKKTVSVPLIVLYAVLEGAFLGAFSMMMEQRWPGIVMTAVIATLCTFAGMFAGYKFGLIKVTSRSRKIFGMMLIGYLLFSLVNVVALMFGWTSGWGFGGSGLLGIGISLLGVGLASYSLAVDFDDIQNAVRAGMPEVLLAAGPRAHRHTHLAVHRDAAAPGHPSWRLTDGRPRPSVSSSAWSSGGVSCRSTTRFRVCPWSGRWSNGWPTRWRTSRGVRTSTCRPRGAGGHGPADGDDLRRGAGRSRPGVGPGAAAARPR